MSVYAIRVWLSKSEKDWFLYRDLEDQVVNTYDSIEKAEEVMNLLECNRAEITEDIPAAALARSKKKIVWIFNDSNTYFVISQFSSC